VNFQLSAEYSPQGDQPEAIQKLVKSIQEGNKKQTLLGVTGSGKTFTMANIIQEIQRPAQLSSILNLKVFSPTMQWNIS
jgi:excinuclease ABC subunit B